MKTTTQTPATMKFSDIPQYPRCYYNVHVELSYLPEQIAHYQQAYGFTMDPEYQRDHVWTDEQRERYVEHILMGGETAREILINCYNFDNRRHTGRTGPAEVLDGKQRLTALLMFLDGKLRAFGKYAHEFEGRCRANIIWRVVDLDELEVMRMYVMLNAGGTVHSSDEIQRVRDLIAAKEAARVGKP